MSGCHVPIYEKEKDMEEIVIENPKVEEKPIDKKMEILSKVLHHVNSLIGLVNLYCPDRLGQNAVTRIEEAALWLQVLVEKGELKPEQASA